MEMLPEKSWIDSVVSSKKYLSLVQSHEISKHMNSDVNDVFFEPHFKKNGKNESGVVEFNKCRGWCSILAIEMRTIV